MQKVNLQVNGMSCQHCVHSIENALKEVGASGHVDLHGHSVAVEFDDSKLTLDAVKEAIEKQGYDVV